MGTRQRPTLDESAGRINPQTGRIEYPSRLRQYMAAHWSGTLPLTRAFWINTVALSAMLLLIETAAGLWFWQQPPDWLLVIMLLDVYIVARITVAAWQWVGALRSASMTDSRWSVATMFTLCIAAPALLGQMAAYGYEAQCLVDTVPSPKVLYYRTVALSGTNDAIIADGTLEAGLVGDIERAFTKYPQAHRLVLNTSHGELRPALTLRNFLIRHPDIAIEVDKQCEGVCLVPFLAASQRIIMPDATLTFAPLPKASDLGLLQHYHFRARMDFRQRMVALGASPYFLMEAIGQSNHTGYSPNAGKLFENGLITRVNINGELVGATQWRYEQFLNPLRARPALKPLVDAMALIRVRYPAVFDVWLKHSLSANYSDRQGQRFTLYERETLRAIQKAAGEASKTVPDAVLQRQAIATRDELSQILATNSPTSCGEYLGGMYVGLGGHDMDYFLADVLRQKELIEESTPTASSLYVPARDVDALQNARLAAWSGVSRHTGQSPYATACPREIRLLDALTATSSPEHSMALRARAVGEDDKGRGEFLFSP